MRWRTPKRLREGDRRTLKYFAFTPQELDDGTTIWLEFFWIEEELAVNENFDPMWHPLRKYKED